MLISTHDPLLTPEQRGLAQNRILLGVYGPEYPLSNVDRAVEQIREWVQSVMFWGDGAFEILEGRGGTMALIADPSKGEWTVEMCRAWATVPNWSWMAAVGALFREYLADSRFRQLYATPRNCLERTSSTGKVIPSGKTISLIYSRLKDVGYWGLAPWYVMPGDKVELLDLRVHTKNDETRERVLAGASVFVRDPDVADLVSSIIASNYGFVPRIETSDVDVSAKESVRFSVSADSSDLKTYLYSTSKLDDEGEVSVADFNAVLHEAANGVDLVKLDLFDPKSLPAQEFVERAWFTFVSLFPQEGKLMGYWFRTDTPLALPYYVEEEGGCASGKLAIQARIVEHVLASVGKSGFSDTMPADSNPPEWNTP